MGIIGVFRLGFSASWGSFGAFWVVLGILLRNGGECVRFVGVSGCFGGCFGGVSGVFFGFGFCAIWGGRREFFDLDRGTVGMHTMWPISEKHDFL